MDPGSIRAVGVPRDTMMVMITRKEIFSRGTLPNPTTAVLEGVEGREGGGGGRAEGE